jgi:L-cysteine desulfidase
VFTRLSSPGNDQSLWSVPLFCRRGERCPFFQEVDGDTMKELSEIMRRVRRTRTVPDVDAKLLHAILIQEIQRTLGCTDPGAIALAAARARRLLGKDPEEIRILLSPNLFKNAAGVGVPGTGQRGIHIAAAAGAVLEDPGEGLAVLDGLDEGSLECARKMVSENRVHVSWEPMNENLYVRADLSAGADHAYAVIQGDYSNILEEGVNGRVAAKGVHLDPGHQDASLGEVGVEELLNAVDDIPAADLTFIYAFAEINSESAQQALDGSPLPFASSLINSPVSLEEMKRVEGSVQRWTGTAGEARMAGLPLPIMALAGSGNQGITSLLGVLSAARELGSSTEKTNRALAYSAAVTIYIKNRMTRLSNLCGCTIASSPGVAAGVVCLLGGTHADMLHAMQTVVGTLAGMLCDGAKESCAYKLSLGASFAVQAAYLAIGGSWIRAGAGILSKSFDRTVENLARLNELMDDINMAMIDMIAENQQ